MDYSVRCDDGSDDDAGSFQSFGEVDSLKGDDRRRSSSRGNFHPGYGKKAVPSRSLDAISGCDGSLGAGRESERAGRSRDGNLRLDDNRGGRRREQERVDRTDVGHSKGELRYGRARAPEEDVVAEEDLGRSYLTPRRQIFREGTRFQGDASRIMPGLPRDGLGRRQRLLPEESSRGRYFPDNDAELWYDRDTGRDADSLSDGEYRGGPFEYRADSTRGVGSSRGTRRIGRSVGLRPLSSNLPLQSFDGEDEPRTRKGYPNRRHSLASEERLDRRVASQEPRSRLSRSSALRSYSRKAARLHMDASSDEELELSPSPLRSRNKHAHPNCFWKTASEMSRRASSPRSGPMDDDEDHGSRPNSITLSFDRRDYLRKRRPPLEEDHEGSGEYLPNMPARRRDVTLQRSREEHSASSRRGEHREHHNVAGRRPTRFADREVDPGNRDGTVRGRAVARRGVVHSSARETPAQGKARIQAHEECADVEASSRRLAERTYGSGRSTGVLGGENITGKLADQVTGIRGSRISRYAPASDRPYSLSTGLTSDRYNNNTNHPTSRIRRVDTLSSVTDSAPPSGAERVNSSGDPALTSSSKPRPVCGDLHFGNPNREDSNEIRPQHISSSFKASSLKRPRCPTDKGSTSKERPSKRKKEHRREAHGKDPLKTDLFNCLLCGSLNMSRHDYEKHIMGKNHRHLSTKAASISRKWSVSDLEPAPKDPSSNLQPTDGSGLVGYSSLPEERSQSREVWIETGSEVTSHRKSGVRTSSASHDAIDGDADVLDSPKDDPSITRINPVLTASLSSRSNSIADSDILSETRPTSGITTPKYLAISEVTEAPSVQGLSDTRVSYELPSLPARQLSVVREGVSNASALNVSPLDLADEPTMSLELWKAYERQALRGDDVDALAFKVVRDTMLSPSVGLKVEDVDALRRMFGRVECDMGKDAVVFNSKDFPASELFPFGSGKLSVPEDEVVARCGTAVMSAINPRFHGVRENDPIQYSPESSKDLDKTLNGMIRSPLFGTVYGVSLGVTYDMKNLHGPLPSDSRSMRTGTPTLSQRGLPGAALDPKSVLGDPLLHELQHPTFGATYEQLVDSA